MKLFNRLLFAVALISFNSISIPANASKIDGAFISYTAISASQYEVQVVLYRDCAAILAPNTLRICYQSVSLGITDTIVIYHSVAPYYLPSQPYFPAGTSACYGGTQFGTEKHIYAGILNLPQPADDWKISTTGPFAPDLFPPPFPHYGTWGLYVSTKIDNLNNPGNSSVRVNFDPKFLYCFGQQNWEFINGFDSDGDSILYEFTDVLLDTMVCPAEPFLNPVPLFLRYEPIASSPPYYLDQSFGWYSFEPSMAQVGFISLKMSEIRNGIVINETTFTHRQIVIFNCIATGIGSEKNPVIKIYPSITTTKVNLEIPNGTGVEVNIFDVTGRLVFKKRIGSKNSPELNLEDLKSGLYFIKILYFSENAISNNENFKIFRILKQ